MDDVFMKRREVEKITGLSRTTIYRLMRSGKFPTPIKMGLKTVRWKMSELEEYIERAPRAEGTKRTSAS